MYCHFCGRPATGACAACGHRLCSYHSRQWLLGPVCKKCFLSIWIGTAIVVALLAGGVVAAVMFAGRTY
jgi:hypothetical protein